MVELVQRYTSQRVSRSALLRRMETLHFRTHNVCQAWLRPFIVEGELDASGPLILVTCVTFLHKIFRRMIDSIEDGVKRFVSYDIGVVHVETRWTATGAQLYVTTQLRSGFIVQLGRHRANGLHTRFTPVKPRLPTSQRRVLGSPSIDRRLKNIKRVLQVICCSSRFLVAPAIQFNVTETIALKRNFAIQGRC